MSEKIDVLVAEDDETDAFLLERAFTEAGSDKPSLRIVSDGQFVVDFLEAAGTQEGGRLPALIVLDLKMPRLSGLEVLEWLRQKPVLDCIPAIVFSSSLRDEDIERSYALGANIFIAKPNSTDERAEVARFIAAWVKLGRPALATTAGLRAAERAHAVFGIGS